jgi:hypothetical protein
MTPDFFRIKSPARQYDPSSATTTSPNKAEIFCDHRGVATPAFKADIVTVKALELDQGGVELTKDISNAPLGERNDADKDVATIDNDATNRIVRKRFMFSAVKRESPERYLSYTPLDVQQRPTSDVVSIGKLDEESVKLLLDGS